MGELIERGTNITIKTCPTCGKNFIPTHDWAYKKKYEYYCRYNCYQQAGGDNGGYKNYVRQRATNIKRKGVKNGD